MKPVPEHEYPTYPRRFLSYRWFKPILVALLFFALYMGGICIYLPVKPSAAFFISAPEMSDISPCDSTVPVISSVSVSTPSLHLHS